MTSRDDHSPAGLRCGVGPWKPLGTAGGWIPKSPLQERKAARPILPRSPSPTQGALMHQLLGPRFLSSFNVHGFPIRARTRVRERERQACIKFSIPAMRKWTLHTCQQSDGNMYKLCPAGSGSWTRTPGPWGLGKLIEPQWPAEIQEENPSCPRGPCRQDLCNQLYRLFGSQIAFIPPLFSEMICFLCYEIHVKFLPPSSHQPHKTVFSPTGALLGSKTTGYSFNSLKRFCQSLVQTNTA